MTPAKCPTRTRLFDAVRQAAPKAHTAMSLDQAHQFVTIAAALLAYHTHVNECELCAEIGAEYRRITECPPSSPTPPGGDLGRNG